MYTGVPRRTPSCVSAWVWTRLQTLLGPQQGAERLTVHVLHHQVRQAARRLHHRMDADDMLVMEPGRQLGLTQQPGLGLRIGQVGTQDLEGHRAPQVFIDGPKDDAHVAAAQLGHDAIRPEPAKFPGGAGRLQKGECPRGRFNAGFGLPHRLTAAQAIEHALEGRLAQNVAGCQFRARDTAAQGRLVGVGVQPLLAEGTGRKVFVERGDGRFG
jgi:hypothetical protein